MTELIEVVERYRGAAWGIMTAVSLLICWLMLRYVVPHMGRWAG